MKIAFWKGVFVADSPSDSPDAPKLKKAGFVFHEPTLCDDLMKCRACRAKIGRRFWSSRIEDATRLKSYCNPHALHMMREHLQKLEKSRAVDSTIVIPAPPGLEYLPYQKAGVSYALQRKDTLIGDEPGLGKTIMGLGFINYVKPRTVLVVCPATLAFNWKIEAEKWLVNTYNIFLPKTTADEIPAEFANGYLLVITNYEKLVGDTKLTKSLERVWDVVIFDEAHALKNPQSKRSLAVLGEFGLLRRSHRSLFLSGTPIENFPKEIWPIAAAISPMKFGDWWTFAHRYCGLHKENLGGKNVWVANGATHLSELQQKLRSSFMVRRLKADVLKELPPKRRQLVVLETDVDWTQHPQYLRWKDFYEKEFEAAMARLEAAKTDVEYKNAVKVLEHLDSVSFTEMAAFRHYTAIVKLPACLKYIDDLLVSGIDSLVIFAHHRDIIEKMHEHFGPKSVMLFGGTHMIERGKIVKDFQDGKYQILIGGLKAAGHGITLTRASTVVFVESDWVPATLGQAEDRLCRIGQKKMVHVIHLVLNGTLDANMSKRVIAKQNVIDKALDHLPEQLRLLQVG